MFGRLKEWRRIAMRYDRAAHTFFSAICVAAHLLALSPEPRSGPGLSHSCSSILQAHQGSLCQSTQSTLLFLAPNR
jgi:hypothetical protein